MGKILKHTSKGEIVFLSKGNYSQLHSSILHTLGKNAPFAPIKITSTAVVWENNSKLNYISIVNAPEDIKGQLMMLFEQESNIWSQKLKKHNLDYVLTVPDQSYIFYAVDKDNEDEVLNNKYHFLITGWACKFNRASNSGSDSLEKDIIEAKEKHQNVIVEMVDGTDRPIANGSFTYYFKNNIVKEIFSDANGRYNQGICLVGSVYKFVYNLTGQERKLNVLKNIELYTLKFSPTTNVEISIVDQFNKPVPSLKTEIKYGCFNSVKVSDGYGKIKIEDLLFDEPSLRIVITPEGHTSQDFAVSCPNCSLVVVVNITPSIRPYLRVIVNGNPADNLTVDFNGAFKGAFSTDSNGKIFLPDLLPSQSFRASVNIEKHDSFATFTVIEGKEEYLLEIITPETTQEPDPDSDPTHDSEPNAPVPFDCHIIVKAIEDDSPLANYSLKIESDTLNGIHITDSNGIVPLGKQIAGNFLKVFTGENNEDSRTITIAEGLDEYVIYVDKPIVTGIDPDHEISQDCHIKVISKITGKPVSRYALVIDSIRMKGNFSTDENGIIPLQNMTVGVNVTVFTGRHQPIQFNIEQYRKEYIIQVDDSNTVIGDILITQHDYDRKTPIPNATLTLTNKKGQKYSQVTNTSGNIVVPRSFFTNNEKVRVHLDLPNRKIKDFSFKYVGNCDHYHLFLKHLSNWKKLLYLLIPIVLMLLCLIRCERDISVQTVNIQHEPISACKVRLEYTEHAFCKNGDIFYRKQQTQSGITNEFGDYTFEKMPCSVFSYIFYTLHKGYASASSPYGTVGETAFVFHWKNHVQIILNDINTNPNLIQNPVNPPGATLLSPCDAGASGRQGVSANSISDPMSYNMGKTKGCFGIVYETGSVCPDQIVIYNHNQGEDWSHGKIVFNSGMVTTPNGEIHQKIPFDTGSVVTVLVTTGPKDGSVWSYQLSCPE